jgi:hypothetical protein
VDLAHAVLKTGFCSSEVPSSTTHHTTLAGKFPSDSIVKPTKIPYSKTTKGQADLPGLAETMIHHY